ncbi:hypothetical protein CTI12_AA354850 [Artemisia annua]|uniref:Uncharacterized protein n=1 Tax=Artemisia annua TaxID=35608 RepID=A0A2U1MPN0_ARTAN|nr:hypothetical protein CTI12_AA354850 [Artemisia annua]
MIQTWILGKEQNNEQLFPLIGFSSEISIPEGVIYLKNIVGTHPLSKISRREIKFQYYILFDRITIQQLWAEMSTIRSHVQFPTKSGIATIKSNYPGKDMELAAAVNNMTIKEIREALPRHNENKEKVVINKNHRDQPIVIEKYLLP